MVPTLRFLERQYDTPLKTVEVVSGSVGPSLLSRSASVVAPGADHPDFQGYGVPLGTFRDDITEEEALMLLMQADAAHIERFQSEADLHEALVLEGPGAVRSRPNQAGFATSVARAGGFRQGSSGSTKSISSPGAGNRRQGNVNVGANRRANAFHSQTASSPSSKNQVTRAQTRSQSSQTSFTTHQQNNAPGGPAPAFNQGAGGSAQNQAGAAGPQFSVGNQGSGAANRPGVFNAANQGTRKNVQYSAGSQGAGQIGYNSNQPAATLRQSAAGNQGSQGNKYSSGNKVSGHDHSASQQHSGAASAGAGKFSSGSHGHKNNAGAKFNQGGSQASQNQGNRGQIQSQFSSLGGANKQSAVRHNQPAAIGHSQFSAGAGQRQVANPGFHQSAVGQQNLQRQYNAPASQHQASNPGRTQYSNSRSAQGHVGQGSSFTSGRQAGAGYNGADQEAALAIIAEQRDNHLRQFRKIAKAHEEIGDEHHQLTLAALQKQKMKIKAW